jgi:hypothetical protein
VNLDSPPRRGQWKAGDRVTLEIDVPKSFANADEAHLYFGVGDAAYFPSPKLLPIPATKVNEPSVKTLR